jgi:hypothetical protein
MVSTFLIETSFLNKDFLKFLKSFFENVDQKIELNISWGKLHLN